MPVINGVCLPHICVKAEFDTSAARLAAVKKDGQPVTDPAKMQALELLFGTAYAETLARFGTPVRQGCDGCTCVYIVTNPPWRALPPYHLAFEPNSEYTVQIAGIRVRVHWGLCQPPGARIKVGDTYIPVEDFVDGLPPKGASGGSGGKKKKSGKGKKKAKKPVKAKRPGRKQPARRR